MIAMNSRLVAALLTLSSVVLPAARAQRPPDFSGSAAPRTVAVRFEQYQRLVDRHRELEERLAREGGAHALDLVIAQAHYNVKLASDHAAVTARFALHTLERSGWKLIPLIGGAVAVSRFAPPQEGAHLVVRDMLPSLAVSMLPGTHYLLTDGRQDGELTLEFLVPVTTEGGVRKLSWVPPAVPLSTLEITAPAADGALTIQPGARVEEVPGASGGMHTYRAALRGGEPLTIALTRPDAPAPASGAGQPSARPAADLVVDQLFAQWTLSDTRIRLRERLVVDVRGGPVDRLVLRKPAGLANVQVREDVGSTLLDESTVGRNLDQAGRQETLELKLRAPVSNRLVRLVMTGDLRADPDAADLALAPLTVDGARSLTEGFATISSQLPHALTVDHLVGARSIAVDRLPVSFAPAEGQPLLAVVLEAPAPVLHVKQQVLSRPKLIGAAIQKLDVTTDLTATATRTRYRAQVSPGTEGSLLVTLPAADGSWSIEDVRGTSGNELSMIRTGTYLLHLKAGDSVPLEFELKHPIEAPRGSGELSLPLARFNVPARNVTWTVTEPEPLRMWGWRGNFADVTAPPDFFVQRFALGIWSWAGQALFGLLEPATLIWILIVIGGLAVVRSAALGRMPLDASMGQLAFIGGVVVLGAVFIHVLTNAANPTGALSDGRGDSLRPTPPGVSAPAPRNTPVDDASGMIAPRGEIQPLPLPGAAAPPPPPTAPLIRAASVEPSGAGGTVDITTQMSAAPVIASGATPAGGGGLLTATSGGAPTAVNAHTGATASFSAPPAAAVTVDGRTVFTRAMMLPSDDVTLTVEASYVERRFESVATAAAMLIGMLVFVAAFLSVRQLLDPTTTNMLAGLGLLILWMLDTRFPFSAPFAAAGFGLPVLLLGSVKLMGHALDVWDAWREEGERFHTRQGHESRGSTENRGGNWSASFPRSGDRNEVPIKEIFAEPPPGPVASAALGSDDISFVTEDDEPGDSPGTAEGGERP